MDLLNNIYDHILGKWTLLGFIILLSWLLGIAIRRAVDRLLLNIGQKTGIDLPAVFSKAGRGHVILWLVLAGVAIGANAISLPPKQLQILNSVCLAGGILSITIFTARAAAGALLIYAQKAHLPMPFTSLTQNLVTIIILIVGILWLLSNLGVSITPMLTALGVGSLAVALALQDTMSNFFAGLYILASRQFRPGDFIKLDSGAEGYVVDIGWRATRIRELRNNMIVVPNAKLAQTQITNYHYPEKEMSASVQVGVAYGSDLDKVERVTIDVARNVLRTTPGGVADFEPSIRFHTFGDSSVNFSVTLRVKEYNDKFLLIHEFIKRLHERYQKEGIEIPFPQRIVRITQSKS